VLLLSSLLLLLSLSLSLLLLLLSSLLPLLLDGSEMLVMIGGLPMRLGDTARRLGLK